MQENPTVSAVCIQALLPLDWQPQPELTAGNAELQRQSNIALLRALSTIETATPEHEAHAEPLEKAIERVESKLDVLLLLVTRMATGSHILPVEKAVALDSHTLAWDETAAAPATGSRLLVNLYLSPRLPQPLQLNVLVETVTGSHVVGKLEGVDADLEEWLTRTLFRHHRRALQAMKSGQQA